MSAGGRNEGRKGSGMEQAEPKGKNGKRAAKGTPAAHGREKRRQVN